MIVVAVNGSVHQNGNTAVLLEKALEPLKNAGWETEMVHIGGHLMSGCRACMQCFKAKDLKCSQDKDIFNEAAEKLFRADAILLGSPTYFTDVTPELKALIDRLGFVAMANGRALSGKIGAAVIAVRRGGGTHAFDTINHLFLMSSMIIPGSTYWNLGFGLKAGDVNEDAEGLANMENLGRVIAWLGSALAGKIDQYPGK